MPPRFAPADMHSLALHLVPEDGMETALPPGVAPWARASGFIGSRPFFGETRIEERGSPFTRITLVPGSTQKLL